MEKYTVVLECAPLSDRLVDTVVSRLGGDVQDTDEGTQIVLTGRGPSRLEVAMALLRDLHALGVSVHRLSTGLATAQQHGRDDAPSTSGRHVPDA